MAGRNNWGFGPGRIAAGYWDVWKGTTKGINEWSMILFYKERFNLIEAGGPGMTPSMAFEIALYMCGNNGQRAIITNIGEDGFMEALNAAWEGEDAVDVLMGMTDHPYAVEEILELAGEGINQYVAYTEAQQTMMAMFADWLEGDPADFEDLEEFEESYYW
jgi:hypothetical protein